MEHGRIARAERPRRAHHGDRRTAAARVVGLRVERTLETVGVESRHVIDHDRVEPRRGGGVVIMRQVGARDEERPSSAKDGGERVAERARSGGRLIAHHQRDDRRARREPLNERQLHFERMLARMRRGVLADDRRRFHELRCALVVDSGDAERRLESAARIQRDAVERLLAVHGDVVSRRLERFAREGVVDAFRFL